MLRLVLLIVFIVCAIICKNSVQAEDNVVYLKQGWSEAERLRYYFTSQGSAVMPYQIFVNLETAGSTELLRSSSITKKYGLIPGEAHPELNPDSLPIGICRTSVPEGRWKGDWVGVSCAACHNGELFYRGKTIRIDGGTSHRIDMTGYVKEINDAMQATLSDEAKFERLVRAVGIQDKDKIQEFRLKVGKSAEELSSYYRHIAVSPTAFGPGRMDALTMIHNQAMRGILGVAENYAANAAPAKPPFVWNTPQSSWVQWSAVANNPISRNTGEAIGVFARIDLSSRTVAEGLYSSTMDLKKQISIESLLRTLTPPRWPEEILGKIDREKAKVGRELFVDNCASCHSVWPHRWSNPKLAGKRFIENGLIPGEYIGTDPAQFSTPTFDPRSRFFTGSLAAELPPPFKNSTFAPAAVILGTMNSLVRQRAEAKAELTEAELLDANGYRDPSEVGPKQPVYKAGPRDGIWAVGPYLHNGSVPTLYDLLLPASQRPKMFHVGVEFDPVKVGVDTRDASGFLLNTSLPGNSNAGHSFEDGTLGKGVVGKLLTDAERWAIIEYLKSIPTEDNQVSPYGGPPNPVEAWSDKTFFNSQNSTGYNVDYTKAATPPVRKKPLTLGEESVPSEEQQFITQITSMTLDRLRGQYPAGKQALRDAHPKTHGLVSAEFEIVPGIPAELRQGLFATPSTFQALIRFSAGGDSVRTDNVPQARGMAIKLLGVGGEKILKDELNATTHDFVMINYPTFFVSNLKDYEAFHEAGAQSTIADFLKTQPKVAFALQGMAQQPFYNPLHSRYWSQTPYALNARMAVKYSARPILSQTQTPPLESGADFLRDALVQQIGKESVTFEFMVQRQLDPIRMPIEDSIVEWPESDSPFVRVALIRIPKQDLLSGVDLKVAEDLSFTPWHALPAHRPLGSINRARGTIYEAVSKFRHSQNGRPRAEPTQIPDLK